MKRKEILINGKMFSYDDESEDITYESISAITEEDAKKILEKTKELFDQINLSFYLCFGTLLGAVREKGLIPGDEDVDVFIKDEKKLYDNLPWLYDNGLKLCRMYKGHFYSFKIGNACYIDVYILRPLHNSIWQFNCYALSGKVTPKKYFSNFSKIDLFGKEYECPSVPENILEFWYGKNWRKPVRGHKYYYEITSAYYWHKRVRPFIVKVAKIMLLRNYWKK